MALSRLTVQDPVHTVPEPVREGHTKYSHVNGGSAQLRSLSNVWSAQGACAGNYNNIKISGTSARILGLAKGYTFQGWKQRSLRFVGIYTDEVFKK